VSENNEEKTREGIGHTKVTKGSISTRNNVSYNYEAQDAISETH
jgi:hypothetical protein